MIVIVFFMLPGLNADVLTDCINGCCANRSWMMVVTSRTGYIKSTPVCLRRFKELWRRASLEFIGEHLLNNILHSSLGKSLHYY